MKPMRFPRRFPWLIVFLIAVGPVLFSVPLTIWYSFTMPPLERYYYDAYFNSTALKNSPSATTDVQWIFKTAPGRTEELAGPADIVSGSSADQERLAVPMKLSSAARDAAWKSLVQGPKERVNAAELQRYLQAEFYGGEGFWRLLLQPALWGVAFILALLALRIWFQGQSKQEERHGRRTKGPELLSALRWNRQTKADGIQLRLRWNNPWLDRFSKFLPGWASPSFRVPRNLEASHLLLMGDTGSGKSSAIRQILRQIAERGETAIVYDPALEFTPEFYSPARGDLILNPLDTRCPYWGLGDEITSDETAMTIAAAFLPEKDYEKEFFTDGPRRILAHLLKRKPQPRDILRLMSNPSQIEASVKGTPLAALLDPAAPAQRSGVLASLNMVADSLELLPEWEHTRPTFATAEWYDERKRWVFLTSQSSYREKILPLHSVWLDLFILRMMGYCDAPNVKPVWFVLDELASLNKLPQLHSAVTENRKYGNPVVMGFQGRSQLEKRYGQDAEAMLSQPATKIFFKTSEPRAAKWISEAIGEIEVERLKESRSMGLLRSKKSFAMEITTKPLVMPSEIAGLEPLHGYIKQGNLVVPAHLPYLKPKAKQPRFIERTVSVSPRSVAVQHAVVNAQQAASTVPNESPKKPVQKQSVFPGAIRQKAGNEKLRDWDESEWIE
ncbi:type IV secretion system DNA-binding domain-containing protein [Granulicella arctica]|uniref:type IV secretion system DNA-binding domain-containing protein n=1 Tax=Granulicella arctica TaxID=940613 RepID=UPI0021E0947C|nr:type IV secretion system DNA-binding domain-containing protein [Granulicella arctica]